ncbi:hypothetical protein ACIBHX_09255 [Nonomuraea sp. NPDC050536]|uniref:hypothetical protein n=1 Tax=Nonomuraea sp. NPDC050536 TaxID=3364366 RepID=UPI0037CA2D58
MKKMLAGLALATAATAIAAAPAQAAPKEPVAAVKQQFVPGKGVKFTDRASLVEGARRAILMRRNGTFEFGKSGVTASDITSKLNIPASMLDDEDKALAKPEHVVTVGRKTYVSGSFWSQDLPAEQPWYKLPISLPSGVFGPTGQLVNITEPATLKTLLKGAKAGGSGYSGTITFGDLKKVSPWASSSLLLNKQSGKQLKSVITWKLTVDAKGLPTRLVTSFPSSALAKGDAKGLTISVDSRYSGWGSTVKVEAPPADQIATDVKDDSGAPEAPQILGDVGKLFG